MVQKALGIGFLAGLAALCMLYVVFRIFSISYNLAMVGFMFYGPIGFVVIGVGIAFLYYLCFKNALNSGLVALGIVSGTWLLFIGLLELVILPDVLMHLP